MRKKLLVILFIAIIAAVMSTSAAAAADFTGYTEKENTNISMKNISVEVLGQKILASEINAENYVFLPSSADFSAVTFNFKANENAVTFIYDGSYKAEIKSGEALNVKNGIYNETTNSYDVTVRSVIKDETALTIDYCEATVKFMKAEKTASMYITAENPAYSRAWLDATKQDAAVYTNYTMAMIEEDSSITYNGKLTQIKGRGNSTWLRPKKPYQIKLDKKTDLLGTGDKANKNKTWILLANAIDKTMIKNAFSFDLARYLGLSETPEWKFVDLYFDGEYRGTYLLCEKVQINDGRVEINDLESSTTVTDETAKASGKNKYGCEYQYNPTAVCTADDITGGYLLEADNAFYKSENSWFKTKAGYVIVIKSPECATKEQVEYISEFFQEMENAAESGKYNGKLLEDYADIDSFASSYILNEYTLNCDYFASSTYFFLPEQGNAKREHKIYASPAWDFDTSMGNRIEVEWMRDPTVIKMSNIVYFKSSVMKSAIGKKAEEINSLYSLIFSEEPVYDAEKKLGSFSSYKDLIYSSIKMNFTLWPCDNTENAFAFPTYEENYEYTRNFLMKRHNSIIPKIIKWGDPVSNCDHICHDNGILGYIWKIVRIFYKIFGINKVCECGISHY